jgi:hypothetical protein
MKRLILATVLALFAVPAPAVADTSVYWPATRERVYVVDARNIGSYGRMKLPRSYSRVVVRMPNGDWGTVPSSLYNQPAPSRGAYSIGY